MSTLAELGKFLLENAELISELAQAIASGAPKDALRTAIREVKVQVSDQAMKEELGL